MPHDVNALNDMCQAILDVLTDGWGALGGEELPARQYVCNGSVAWDCEQLTVHTGRMFSTEASPANEGFFTQPSPGAFLRGAVFVVTLIRCAPDVKDDGSPPTVGELSDSAQVLNQDAIAVFEVLAKAQRDGDLAHCQALAFDSWVPQGPEGGYVAGITSVRMTLI